ncbi:hypothetical protein AX769_14360 [Frondihabitans sp. PAMC 28766]|uniref:hypothetical protein n=1 Tax=Frondihabitans sp. PAMC 28766 TaxID=1795630 RepID=UPI00078C7D67|nr:hypothetical protein [Frondihabitans sp. PAMC 28766]AMM21105.1 hypothetical protein AX769_14360 [Frondihabitans sp. PAMC 28766]
MPPGRLEPHPALLVTPTFDDTAVRRAAARGELVRVVAGRYVRREHWGAFDARERHAMLCLAAISRLSAPVVLSHASAAALWGLPRLGPWPARAHVTDPALSHATTTRYASWHVGALPPGDVTTSHGVRVTTPERTALDLASTTTFRQAVVSLDHCLRTSLVTNDELLLRLASKGTIHGRAKALRAIEFANAKANRPGESLSRVVIHESGLVVPDLQHPFTGLFGQSADVDFFWEREGIVGEFDGETKYRDSGRWSGLPPEEVVIREKDRENWIRAQPEVRGFIRWTWRDAFARGRLARLLLDRGVPLESGRFRSKRSV